MPDLTPTPDEVDPDTLECRCENPDDQYLMEIDSSSLSLVHAACGRPAASWTDDALFMERIPVTMTWNAITDHWAGDVDAWGDLAINAGAAQEQALATIERLRNHVYGLAHRQPSAQRCTACGHTGIVHDLPDPRGCMADIASCPCPGWAAPCSYPSGPCVCPGTEGIAQGETAAAPVGPERVVICGSTRHTAEMAAIEQLLTWRGASVFAPTKCDLKSPNPLWDDPAERAAGAARLADLHAAMIRDAHWVLVVGPYAGDSTRGEIAHSQKLGKPVRFTDPGLAAEFNGEVWQPETVPTA